MAEIASLDIVISPRGAQSGAHQVNQALDNIRARAKKTTDAMGH